ncbi:MAG: hypothetical protein COT16_03045 [Elusimicrobia bacterium CG08_land_8_20_14_0_20_44_26]|nr:MAG: hypothetical protein COT16_03045 [Elusimicrobia bacterium CG08_land_8_20_14_0_20_44_26]
MKNIYYNTKNRLRNLKKIERRTAGIEGVATPSKYPPWKGGEAKQRGVTRMRKIIGAVLIGLLVFNSAEASRIKKVWSSAGKKPKWISVFPEKKGYHYFVGISQNQEDSGVALQRAIEEALKQVLTTIGVVAGSKMRIDKEISENKEVTKMLDQYKENSRGRVKGHKIQEVYTEEYRDDDRRFYDVYVLMMYSDAEIKNERSRIEDQQAENRRLANDTIRGIDGMLKDGRIADAYQESARVFTMLADQPGASQYELLKSNIKKMLSGFAIEPVVVSGKNPSVKLSLNWNGKKTPAPGIKMVSAFKSGAGVISTPQTTGGDGIAVFPISKIKFEAGLAKIEVKPAEEQFTDSLKNAYMDDSDIDSMRGSIKETYIEIILKAADFGGSKFCLIIWNDGGKRENAFEVSLMKELTTAGISVRTFAELPSGVGFDSFESKDFYDFLSSQGMDTLIVGRLGIIDNGDVYNLKSVTTQIDIKVSEIKTRKMLAAFQKANTGVQINFERAKQKTSSELAKELSPQIIEIAGVQ